MSDREIGIKISDHFIKDVVHQEILKSISEDREGLVAEVVRQALWGKTDCYSRDNHFTKACRKMVQEVAVEAFKGWLAESREAIKAKMLEEMSRNKGAKLKDFVDKLVEGTASVHGHVSISYKALEDD